LNTHLAITAKKTGSGPRRRFDPFSPSLKTFSSFSGVRVRWKCQTEACGLFLLVFCAVCWRLWSAWSVAKGLLDETLARDRETYRFEAEQAANRERWRCDAMTRLSFEQ
jgi:hypothetical protein